VSTEQIYSTENSWMMRHCPRLTLAYRVLCGRPVMYRMRVAEGTVTVSPGSSIVECHVDNPPGWTRPTFRVEGVKAR
jgi:hypothetical protein